MKPMIIPYSGPRVETGPLQFGSDWPGMFIRGDMALSMSMTLESIFNAIQQGKEVHPISLRYAQGFVGLLRQCNAGDLSSAQPDTQKENT